MSWTGQCPDCGRERMRENIIGLHTHSGPALHRWRRGVAAAVGGILIDEHPDAT